ncbi:MAG: MFS transporter [Synergistaceae bacterium]|jgi:MFS family permease|nr:MFS transporter [Synergistaceae bacterium]
MTLIKKVNLSDDTRLLISIFLPLYAIHCMEQLYFIYGNVLKGYGISSQTIGWILGAFFITIMFSRPIGSWMLERFGIRRTLATAGIIGFAGCFILFAFKSVPLLFAGRVLSGAAFGIFSMGLFSYQAITVTENIRGASFAITAVGGMLPTATVTPLGEWLLLLSHEKMYLAIGPIMCVICIFLSKIVGAGTIKKRERAQKWGNYRELLSYRSFVMLAVTGTIMALVDAATVSMSLLASEHQLITSYFLSSSAVAAVILRLGFSSILNKLPRSFCLAPCGMLMSGALFAISIAPSHLSFMIWGALFGIGIGAGFPLFLAAMSDTLPPPLRPKGTASALFLYDLGWFVTPLLVGYATPLFGIAWTFRSLALVTFLAMTGIMLLYWAPAHFGRPPVN